ncbi:MAG: hypothetical protein Kow00107_08290 [Planctomycetota bacterium]
MINFIYYTAWTVLIIDSLLLILLILAQESKSQGLGGLGGGMDMSFGGHAQRTAKRLTVIFAIIFAICIGTVILVKPTASTGKRPEGAPEISASPEAPAPQISFAPGENQPTPADGQPAPAK